MDKENLLDKLQDLKIEVEEIIEDIKRYDFLAENSTDDKELKEIYRQLKNLNEALKYDKKEMSKIMKKLEKM